MTWCQIKRKPNMMDSHSYAGYPGHLHHTTIFTTTCHVAHTDYMVIVLPQSLKYERYNLLSQVCVDNN